MYIIGILLTLATGFIMAHEDRENQLHHEKNALFATTEPGIARSYDLYEFRICATDVETQELDGYLTKVADLLGVTPMNVFRPSLMFTREARPDHEPNIKGILVAYEGIIILQYWRKPRLLTLTLEMATSHHRMPLAQITKQHFGLIESTHLVLNSQNVKLQNSKVEVRTNPELGRGVFAKERIKKGEFIGGLYGAFHEAEQCMDLPEEYRDHVMQCGEHIWRGNETVQEAVQYLNHSCDPNCGVQGLFDFVALKDIEAGQELTTDYAMQDDSNWQVPGGVCLCGAANCRGDILPYRQLAKEEKDAYKAYVSHWILHRYKVCSCWE